MKKINDNTEDEFSVQNKKSNEEKQERIFFISEIIQILLIPSNFHSSLIKKYSGQQKSFTEWNKNLNKFIP